MSDRGFTLLEVLLAMTLVGLVLGVIFAAYQVAGDAFIGADRLTGAAGEVRAAYRQLENDISAAYYSPYDQRFRFDGRMDSLAFTVRGGETGLSQVWYGPDFPGEIVERVVTDGPVQLIDSFVRPEGKSIGMLRGRASFQYLNEKTGYWSVAWRSDIEGGLPSAVRVTFALEKNSEPSPPLTVRINTGRAYRGGAMP